MARDGVSLVMMDADMNMVTEAATTMLHTNKISTPLAELKNGKVFFKQKCVSLEKLSETMQEIVNFREMLQQRIQNKEPTLSMIPKEHRPLIGKLVHESDKTLPALCKHIQQQLIPTDEEESEDASPDSALPLTVIGAGIKSMAQRKNYGLDSGSDGVKTPASLCIWRWELDRNLWDWLPKSAREKAETRYQERLDAKQHLATVLALLSREEKDALLNTKAGAKQKRKGKEKETPKDNVIDVDDTMHDGTGAESNETDAKPVQASSTPPRPVGRSIKVLSPETTAKEKEKLVKKAAKAEKDKKKKDAQEKSKSLMANFFAKGKSTSTDGASPRKGVKDVVKEANPSTSQSDFDKTFKPFALKKGVELAPDNWFKEAKKGRFVHSRERSSEVIVIDGDDGDRDPDVTKHDGDHSATDLSSLSALERLSSLLAQLPPSANPSLLRRPPHTTPQLKTHSTYSIREIMSQLSEAEVAGDESRVRDLLNLLRSRSKIPAKIFCFTDDARPGYFGTFTRTSRIIGLRCPFARDTVAHDYNYDSGEEWEEEGEGEGVDDGSDEEKETAADEEDSDLDSWLVDDDDVEEPGTPIEDREGSPGFFPPLPSAQADKKRKSAVSESRPKGEKKRKVVVPLVPFTKGPCWENTIGKCDYEPFEPYRIQLFNDTPFPVDPFTFVSAPPPLVQAVKNPTPVTHGVFLVPSIPNRVQPSASTASDSASSAQANVSTGSVNIPKRASVPTPKTSFPEDHLPVLLDKIRSSQTSNLTVLVEMIYSTLQGQGVKVKKNAVEMKVREVGEKCKSRKVWVVKGEPEGLATVNAPPAQ